MIVPWNNVNPFAGISNYFFKEMIMMLSALYLNKVITKLPNSEQSYKGKVKTHKYIYRQNQSSTGKL